MLEGGWARLPQGNSWKLPGSSPLPDDGRKSAGLEAKLPGESRLPQAQVCSEDCLKPRLLTIQCQSSFTRRRTENEGPQREGSWPSPRAL